jgi:DNA gyrase subunit A
MSFERENETIVPRNLEEEMKESYLRYSMSVIISRALPDVRDGLKPSQRRILFAMRQLNLSPGSKYRKCAKICGDTSGDYHPHGESVIYPTLVRMAQEWSMRYPLVDGQGNFGSVDGDPPAAMRYTEARLKGSAIQLMEDLDKETVDMVPNYDETKVEPTVFPSKFPNLLSNGSSGIAVGMATNIPPHNLNELIEATLLLLHQKDVPLEEILKVMPGPDFPTGGIICGTRGIHEAYATGRGKVILRGKVETEEVQGSGRERIVVTELPYNVNKSRLVENIADLVNTKSLTGLSDVRDESDKDGMRIVLELKRGEMADVIINKLYKYTDLQVTFGCNMLALDKNLPRTLNIKQMIQAWISHRIDVIRRRTRFELRKAEARAHILEGYLKAIDNLDEVVRIVRTSGSRDEAREQLMESFDLSERQANAVLDLRLYQLTGLEQDKIQSEYNDLLEKIAYYRSVLADEGLVRGIISDELAEIQKATKGGERRSQIVAAEGEFNMEDLIADESTVITISEDDYVKRMPLTLFREQRRGGQGVTGFDIKKEGDALKGLYAATTHDTLMIFTTLGRCYWLKVWQIPEGERRSKGKPLINLLEDIQPGERIATVLCTKGFEGERFVFMATKHGIVKKIQLSQFSNQRRKGVRAVEIDEGDELIAARMLEGDQQVMLFSRGGMAVRFEHDKVRAMGRTARGVKGITLAKEDDAVVGCEVVSNEEQSVLVVCENGFGKRSLVGEFRQTNRGGKGVKSIITSERNGQVVGAISVTDEDGAMMISESGQTVRIAMNDLRVMGRSTQGVKVVNLKKDDKLLALVKLDGNVEEETQEEKSSE